MSSSSNQYGNSGRDRRYGRSNSGSHPRAGTTARVPSRSSSSSFSRRPPIQATENESDQYARELQEKYRQEFLQRQAAHRSRQVRATAPPASDAVVVGGNMSQGVTPVAPPPIVSATYSQPVAEPEMEVVIPPFSSEPVAYTSSSGMMDDDAAYARQVQQELEREERLLEAARQRNNASTNNYRGAAGGTTTATTTTTSPTSRYDITPVSNREPPVRRPFDEDLDEDVRYAQQLQDEELARQLESEGTRGRTSYGRSSSSGAFVEGRPPPPRSNSHSHSKRQLQHYPSNVRTNSTDSDTSSEEAAARRIAQEMDDAEMAQRLALYEEEADRRRVTQQPQQGRQGFGRTGRLLVGRVLPLLCCGAGVAIALLFVLGVFDPQDVPFVGDRFGGDDWVDPFEGDVTFKGTGNASDGQTPIVERNDQMRWSTDGRSGIRLEILNAMEDRWENIFQTAVQNWDDGYPVDSLTLRTTRIGYEVGCTAASGKIKVCNADYGDTRWRGLNELMLNRRTNVIVSSSAKMNEFYLQDEGTDQRLYTLCHELGHGFGLPHWDENFFNEDMGNCMDYTNNPDVNMRPDASNFEFLRQIYGGVDVSTGQQVSSTMETSPSSTSTGGVNMDSGENMQNGPDHDDDEKEEKDKKSGGGKRQRRRNTRSNRTGPKGSYEDGLRSSSLGLPTVEENSNPEPRSRVLLSPQEEEDVMTHRRRRRVLFANDYIEVHRIAMEQEEDNEEDNDLVKLQYYLLASTA